MIETKIIIKQRDAATSSTASTSTSTTGSASVVEADKAKRAEVAELADYATKSGTASRADYAAKAGELDEEAETLKKYVRKDIDDEVHGHLSFDLLQTFLKGIRVKDTATLETVLAKTIASDNFDKNKGEGFGITLNTDGSYTLTLEQLVAWGLAMVDALQVSGDASVDGNTQLQGNMSVRGNSRFSGELSSPDFVSGFLAGKGWRIKNNPVENAAGVLENKYTQEIDNLIVRGTMRIFEMVVSQLLGENDNRIFTAMLEVDHYDPDTGRVYLDTKEGKYYNPFRKDDCIMVQQYNGMPSADNNHYVTKQYELIVTDVGSEGTGENMLAWVTFKNFTCSMEGATPDTMITKKDTFTRVDNLTDPDRKGIIELMTVGSDTPYMDILYGLKTDPEHALRGRLGNLAGIVHPVFGALQGFGELLQNLYATGDLIMRRTGESIDTRLQMLENMFSTRFAQTSYDLTNDNNYLENGQFLMATGTDSDNIIDAWTIDSSDETLFWVDATGAPILVNGQPTVSGNKRVYVESNEGRNMLHLKNCGIKQTNAHIRKPGTHKEYTKPSGTAASNGLSTTGNAYSEVQDTLYVSVKIYVKASGTLTVGFENGTAVSGKANELTSRSIAIDYTGEWRLVEFSGKWNGTGDFVIRFTGDAFVSLATITDQPLSEMSKTVSTQIEQTATNIKLLGQNIDKVNGTATQLGIDLDSQNKSIRAYVDETDKNNRSYTSSSITVAVNNITSSVNQQFSDQYGKITKEYQSSISQSSSSILSTVKSYDYATNSRVAAAESSIKQTADSLNAFVKKVSFDSSGNVTNISKSGLLVTADKTELESKISTVDGKVVTKATISTMISNGISTATIQADHIQFSGHTTTFNSGELVINSTNFKLDSSGNVTMAGTVKANSGNIGAWTISNNELNSTNYTYSDSTYTSRLTPWGIWMAQTHGGTADSAVTIVPYGRNDGLGMFHAMDTAAVNRHRIGYSVQLTSHGSSELLIGLDVNLNTGGYGTEPLAVRAKQGMFAGLRPYCRTISASTTLDTLDCVVHCENTSGITVRLPSSPEKGQMVLVIQHGTGSVTINGNGKKIWAWGVDGGDSFTSSTRYQFNWIFYNGTYWDLNFNNHS